MKTHSFPPHACEIIKSEVGADDENVQGALKAAKEQGQSQADIDEQERTLPVAERMVAICAQICDGNGCAMRGFGRELIGANPDKLSEVDQARAELYRLVDTSHFVTEMRLGVAL